MGKKSFKFDARTILTLGRDSIKDHTTAILELVKNSYDADARVVEVDLLVTSENDGFIRIADNGEGMSEEVVENNWLRVGYSGKRQTTTTGGFRRRKTGEKGIGRLSADRLGCMLELRTKADGKQAVGLEVDWRRFDSAGSDVSDIEFPPLEDITPKLPGRAKSGTELRISMLRQEWTRKDVEKLCLELSLLLPPYEDIVKAFEIRFRNDVVPELNGTITPPALSQGEIEFDGNLSKDGTLKYFLKYRDPNSKKRKKEPGTLKWEEMRPRKAERKRNAKSEAVEADDSKFQVGPARIRLSFFLRRADVLDGSGFSLSQLKAFLDQNSGIRIYRDNVRVKPYGEPDSPDGDWLGLSERKAKNPAGAARESFTIHSSQIVGGVFISRDGNPNLIDSSSREGLIEGDEFRQLCGIVMRCLMVIETRHHMSHIETAKNEPATNAAKAKAAVVNLRKELSTLKSELVGLQSSGAASGRGGVSAPIQQIEVVLERIAGAEKQIDEIASQNTVFRGLASVGIASAVFGHETEISTASAQSSLTLARLSLQAKKMDVPTALHEISQADEALDQIASWGRFALLRMKKDKRQRQKVSITKIVAGVLAELEKPMEMSSIKLTRDLADVSSRTFPMDVEAVVINFLTNAYHAVKAKRSNRSIQVHLADIRKDQRPGFQIVVSDSGHGIEKAHADMIWEPLFSTRVDEKGRATGTGLGLTIVKSAVEELGGAVEAIHQGRLGGAEFKAWFPHA